MKQVVCTYCEGDETKVAIVAKDQNTLKVIRTFSIQMQPESPEGSISDALDFSTDNFEGDFAIEEDSSTTNSMDDELSQMASELYEINLTKSEFIPVVSEPIIDSHIFEGTFDPKNKKFNSVLANDIMEKKGVSVAPDQLDFYELSNGNLLTSFIDGNVPCVENINSLAKLNKRKYYKISGIKHAEISLQYLIAKSNKFFKEDFTLVIYTGKEYSKLIFLEGKKLKHIGTTLDIGTQNLHTYDVYFSKILLEMENGGIPRLDNVVLCGEDNSENLILSFYGTFPEANVVELKFNEFDFTALEEEAQKNISAYSIPLAAALEYFDEQDKLHKGINILPKYIKENQKFLQFGWHSYAILPILFFVTYFFTVSILQDYQKIKKLENDIKRLTELQISNQTILDEMNIYSTKISGFGKTKAILDSAIIGTEIWSKTLDRVSNFVERRRNFWVSKIETKDDGKVQMKGYSLSRKALTEFANYNNSSILQNILYEPLRERNAFAYLLNFDLFNQTENTGWIEN